MVDFLCYISEHQTGVPRLTLGVAVTTAHLFPREDMNDCGLGRLTFTANRL